MLPKTTATRRPNRTGNRALRRCGAAFRPNTYSHVGQSALTVEAWVRTGTNLTDYQVFLSKNGPFQLILRNANFRGALITSGNSWVYAFGTTTVQTNTWYHVALVYEQGAASPVRLYLNGALEATASAAGTLVGNGQLNFGGRGIGGAPNELFFQGRLDEVRLSKSVRDVPALWAAGDYARELRPDADTVGLWHCNEGTGSTVADSSVTGADGTLGGGAQAPAWLRSVQWSNAFAYDDAGNRTQWVKTAGSSLTYDYNYNSLNQLEHYTLSGYKYAFSYDANGNRTAMQILLNDTPTGYVKEYEWNEDDRLTRVTASLWGTPLKTVEYQYCRTCGGQRTGRVEHDEAEMVVEWLRYEMDGLNYLRIDEVFDADSNGELEDPSATGDAWRVQRVYVNGPGQLGQIAKVIVPTYASATSNTVASEDVYYYHYDILGNVSVISDPAGDEADQFEQDAFGNLVSGAWTTRIAGITEQITTKPYDVDLGLYYFNARWYDPVVGGFLSRSPMSPDAEEAYVFCSDNPCLYVDSDGRDRYIATQILGVKVDFYDTMSDNLNSYQAVKDAMAELFERTVASTYVSCIVQSIRSDWPTDCAFCHIGVSATTNGHGTRGQHPLGEAVDSSRINGIRMKVIYYNQHQYPCETRILKLFQEMAKEQGAYRVFGPFEMWINRDGGRAPRGVPRHDDHVHLSIKGANDR